MDAMKNESVEAPLDKDYIDFCWNDYRQAVMPRASKEQLVACKHAFVGGCGIMLAAMKRSADELAGPDEFQEFMNSLVDYFERYTLELINDMHDKATD